jgi:hypothetical protein
MKDKGLDPEKMQRYAIEFSLEIAQLILKKKKSKEMHAGMVAAMADILVLMCCRMVGTKMAYEEIVPMENAQGFQMAKGYKGILEADEQQIKEEK